MKKFVCLILSLWLSGLLWAQIPPQPDPPRLVNDYAGVLTEEQVDELEYRLVAFNDSTSNVICVVIVNDLGGYSAAEFAYEIGDKWGVKDKKFNNGVVILIKPSSAKGGDGDIYIATGYDLEGVLPDAACKRIIEQQFIPELKQGNYYQALVNGLDVILPAVAGEINVAREDGDGDEAFLAGFVFFLFIMVIVLIVSASRSSHNRKGGKGSGDGNGNNEDLLNAIFWGSLLSNGHRGGSGYSGSSGFGGGFGGGSFGGGGFGGFGGSGGFGGGGAGGRF
ncbi:MAG: TPM domain-containing protein [Bacteroidales bacterium]|nr:TPM domain-containing protein [Bacteroidales bacterium]